MIHWYWKDGTPAVTAEMGTPEWSEQMRAVDAKMRDEEYSRIARTDLGGGRYVSTVWLGLDQRLGASPAPVIFESMMFPDLECERYYTEEQARLGHEDMVNRWRPKH